MCAEATSATSTSRAARRSRRWSTRGGVSCTRCPAALGACCPSRTFARRPPVAACGDRSRCALREATGACSRSRTGPRARWCSSSRARSSRGKTRSIACSASCSSRLPLALLLASLAGYALAAAALRPVEAMRRRAASVSAASPGRLPVPPSGDEISRLGDDPQRDARPARGGLRARAPLRRRREPRAAHAAGAAACRDRDRPAASSHARRSSRRRCDRRARRRSACRAWPRI